MEIRGAAAGGVTAPVTPGTPVPSLRSLPMNKDVPHSKKPETLDKRVTTQGVFDPPEPDEPLPDGLMRERMGPLNKDTGRRPVRTY